MFVPFQDIPFMKLILPVLSKVFSVANIDHRPRSTHIDKSDWTHDHDFPHYGTDVGVQVLFCPPRNAQMETSESADWSRTKQCPYQSDGLKQLKINMDKCDRRLPLTCSVFPMPLHGRQLNIRKLLTYGPRAYISSARIQPLPSWPRIPITHSYMNFTPVGKLSKPCLLRRRAISTFHLVGA